MGRIVKYTRRAFLGLGAAAAGGLAVGYYFYRKPYANPLKALVAEGEVTFNPYLTIGLDNSITIIAPRAEMGQGIHTTLAAFVAEELDVDLGSVAVEHGPASPAYFNEAMLTNGGPYPFFDNSIAAQMTQTALGVVAKFLAMQVTGGSSATVDAFVKMREAGAGARQVLMEAAAENLGVALNELETGNGQVVHTPTGNALIYGALAGDAARRDAPARPPLRPASEWRLLGKPQPRVDGRDKVTGAPIFGIDVELPDMLHGTVIMSPRFGAGPRSVEMEAARSVPGVREIVPIETTTGQGFGIIADHTWAAFRGAEALKVVWEDAAYPPDTAGLEALYDAALEAPASHTFIESGNVERAFADAPADDLLEADYVAPFLAHATMEPMNATARFRDGHLEIWTGTQAPGIVQMTAATLLGIDRDAVTVTTTRLGGGFGRRGEVDYPLYAAALAARTDGCPIKVTWTREEDTRHDAYRPMGKARFRALAPKDALPTALDVRIASPSVMASAMKRTFPDLASMGADKTLVEGAHDQPLTISHRRFEACQIDFDIPVGFWRSVGNSMNAFFYEGFMDEMAERAGRDPLDFRLALMNEVEHGPARAVLKRVAEMASWTSPLPEGRGRGIAHTLSFGTWVAEVVEVTATEDGIRIDKVWCTADPGVAIDPGLFRDQMMSGIVFGLCQAISQEVTFADGMVEQSNFHDFDILDLGRCPPIEIEILQNSPRIGGAGEPGTPPAAPALANAIFAATGTRLRRMPFNKTVDFA
ncbi:MAG: molybdopterin cofactor-binding domain-containing protein [Pseudomonadota bacterium]